MRVLQVLWFIFRTAAGALGWGVRLLDYRKVDEHVYDATRWVTVFFFPLVPLNTWTIRPRTAEAVNLGAVVQSRYDFELLAESVTPPTRIIRMYLFAWIFVPTAMAAPLAGALIFARSQEGGAPSSLKTALLLAAAVWAVVVVGLLNHRREKLFAWGTRQDAAMVTRNPRT